MCLVMSVKLINLKWTYSELNLYWEMSIKSLTIYSLPPLYLFFLFPLPFCRCFDANNVIFNIVATYSFTLVYIQSSSWSYSAPTNGTDLLIMLNAHIHCWWYTFLFIEVVDERYMLMMLMMMMVMVGSVVWLDSNQWLSIRISWAMFYWFWGN